MIAEKDFVALFVVICGYSFAYLFYAQARKMRKKSLREDNEKLMEIYQDWATKIQEKIILIRQEISVGLIKTGECSKTRLLEYEQQLAVHLLQMKFFFDANESQEMAVLRVANERLNFHIKLAEILNETLGSFIKRQGGDLRISILQVALLEEKKWGNYLEDLRAYFEYSPRDFIYEISEILFLGDFDEVANAVRLMRMLFQTNSPEKIFVQKLEECSLI